MHKQILSAAEAARALGISLDTLRRWDRAGKIRVERDAANRRVVPFAEVERLRGTDATDSLSARNHFRGVVRSVEVDGLLARVEIDVTEPARVVAIITRESVEELGLKPGCVGGGRGQVDERDGGAMTRVVAAAVAFWLLAAGVAVGSTSSRASDPPVVFAAASLTEVLPRIAGDARYSFGGSNQLAQQIRQGAPADVFVSASREVRRGSLRDWTGAEAGAVRDEHACRDRPEVEPREDPNHRRPCSPPEASARRCRAEGADRPVHPRSAPASGSAAGASQGRQPRAGRERRSSARSRSARPMQVSCTRPTCGRLRRRSG